MSDSQSPKTSRELQRAARQPDKDSLVRLQLWRFRDSGRRAGIILFGYGLAYY
jgi:hypothetical protein